MPRQDVPRTRAGGQWTEARFWAFIRSGLRQLSRRWPPRALALKAARRRYQDNENPRQLWEFQCVKCGQWWPQKLVQVDHIDPCGALTCLEELPGFVKRLLVEADGFQVLCLTCHPKKTKTQRR